ncbi:hypothetical protein UlMin_005386 [Ulmus minor]
MERAWKPNVELSPHCPRCGCSNTKFCYYNNYSLTQPRYFCKGCRRYWTKGGSLRNVPVGGGCRKNRRGKSLRLATTTPDGVHSKSLAYGSVSNSYGPSTNNGSFLADSSRSSLMSDGSHIDLALVYSNFLNQKPNSNSKNGPEMPELPSDHFDPSLEFSSIQLPHENGLIGCHSLPEFCTENLPSANEQMYFCGLDSFQKQYQDQRGDQIGLPPLPGQEVMASDHEVLWSSCSSDHMMVAHSLQATTHLPMEFGPEEAHQDQNFLTGNWSPFDLPSDHHIDTFSSGQREEI